MTRRPKALRHLFIKLSSLPPTLSSPVSALCELTLSTPTPPLPPPPPPHHPVFVGNRAQGVQNNSVCGSGDDDTARGVRAWRSPRNSSPWCTHRHHNQHRPQVEAEPASGPRAAPQTSDRFTRVLTGAGGVPGPPDRRPVHFGSYP